MKNYCRLFIIFLMFLSHPGFAQTKEPDSVTLAGDMQKLLGCSEDWQPSCALTQLTRNGDEWSAGFMIPAGTWEYKIALNNNWTESYGYNLGSSNARFTLTEEKWVTFTYQQNTHLVADDATAPGGGTPVIEQPHSVTLAGDFQQHLGCTSDWQADCLFTALEFSENDQRWQRTFVLPSGEWQFKVTLNGGWEENYGHLATAGGENIVLNLTEETSVSFFYEHGTHWVTSSENALSVTVTGDFQEYLGCTGIWLPDCFRGWLQDPDGNGLYTFSTTAIPVGSYETKVLLNGNWDTAYGDANGNNIAFSVTSAGQRIHFTFDAVNQQVYVGEAVNAGDLFRAKAFWLNATTLVWPLPDDVLASAQVSLHIDPSASLSSTPAGVQGGESFLLTYAGKELTGPLAEKFPHLQHLPMFTLPAMDQQRLSQIVKSQLAVSARRADNSLIDATALQIPGVLDDRFHWNGNLGIGWENGKPVFRLWAPTARAVTLHIFADDQTETATEISLQENPETGVWEVEGDAGWDRLYYLYEVEVFVRHTGKIERNRVTDPYTVSASINGVRSQIVNLDDADLLPEGWATFTKPEIHAPEDMVIYELHVRDFSIDDDTVPAALRGSFLAFAEENSQGVSHLRQLAEAGLTHVHLLPVADCATIPEDKSMQQQLDSDLSVFAADGHQQQEAINQIRNNDGFNWCYDPHHYNLPEGSYATDANGVARIVEFRKMVQALNMTGLRVVMDVVYNHTSGSLLGDKSVLDKVVPGYYHRLNAQGDIETSTCCANTATEHLMMEKLMLDSLELWATAYKVDGFRFDIMGHHSMDNLLAAKQRLQALTPTDDDVDGSSLYLYGEGWNFGEVENNRRFLQASIDNIAGTGIGTFNNRIRDAVRGGGPFDTGLDHVRTQSFINGLYLDPNTENQANAESREGLLMRMDHIRAALAGSLQDYQFTDRRGTVISGKALDFEGQSAGYAADPQEVINYIEAHDNETLFDSIQYKAPLATSADDRVRMQNLGSSILLFSQGIPFIHAGQELLRSKSMDRNSYDAGDWFNVLDFTRTTNGWGRGLPLSQDNEQNWSVIAPRLADPALQVGSEHIDRAFDHMLELLAIRKSSKLFRLETAEQIQRHVHFYNTGAQQTPGLIVMALEDEQQQIDPQWKQILVLFNANISAQTFTLADRIGNDFALHPVQLTTTDSRLQAADFNNDTGSFTVPARSTAVFVSNHAPIAVAPEVPSTEPPAVKKKSSGSMTQTLLLLMTLLMLCYWARLARSRKVHE